MAVSQATFSDLGGAVSDLFAGIAATTSANLKAQGLQIEAMGTDITAQSLITKAQGDIAEGQEYGLAATLAQQNSAYTAASTRIQASQEQRTITQTMGTAKAAVAGSGLASGGSSFYLLRDSAAQGGIALAALRQQGAITEAGYNEQAASYQLMQTTAQTTATEETAMAGKEEQIATAQRNLAAETAAAGKSAAVGDFLAGAVKGVAAIATLL